MGLKKSLSLGQFYWRCTKAYFRPGNQWNLAHLFSFFERIFYYYCNWCYTFFLNILEYIFFFRKKQLITVEKTLNEKYFHTNQFWISLQEGLKIEPNKLYRLTYGETSWFAIDSILKRLKLNPEDIFYDLGCGVGRNIFFANIVYGATAKGIDLIPSFVNIGNQVIHEHTLNNIEFIENDVFKQDLTEATVAYVTANCYDKECMEMLIERIKDLKPGTRLVSTGKPIPDPSLELFDSKVLFFSWGIGRAYFYLKH